MEFSPVIHQATPGTRRQHCATGKNGGVKDRIFAELADVEQDVIAPRELLFDKTLLDGAVRLMLITLALLNNPRWRLTETGFATLMDRSRRQICRYIRNLKERHYLVIDKHRDAHGRWDGHSWTIYRRSLDVSVRRKELPIFKSVSQDGVGSPYWKAQ
jgi:hypothetical protein